MDSCTEKECPFSGVTNFGIVWRKVPESDARSVIQHLPSSHTGVSTFSLAAKAGKQKDFGSIPLRLSPLFKICDIYVHGHGIMTLSLTVNEILKWHLNAGVILMVIDKCSARYSLPLLPPPWISVHASTSSETVQPHFISCFKLPLLV